MPDAVNKNRFTLHGPVEFRPVLSFCGPMKHIIRPYKWAEQIVLLIPKLKSRDTILVHCHFVAPAVRHLLQEWGVKAKITVSDVPCHSNCQRCGSSVFHYTQKIAFCDSCSKGVIHAQTCPQLWADVKLSNAEAVERLGLKLIRGAPGPCNCGGDKLVDSLKHAENQLQLS